MRALVLGSALLSLMLVGCPGDKTDDSAAPDDSNGGTGCSDIDGDGYCAEVDDCDDNDASVNPGVDEECDGLDNDCNGTVDEGVTGTYYADTDGDGFGDDGSTIDSCESAVGWVAVGGDCDDTSPYVYPGSEELCDGIDNDCDEIVDNDLDSSTWYQDSDGDSYGNPDEALDACSAPGGYVDNAIDCDDTSSLEPVHADAESGSATGTGSAANPLDSLQDAIDLAEVCVFGMAGEFMENIDFGGKNIAVYGVDGAGSTFITGDGSDSVVTFANGETSGAILTGFTISGGGGKLETTVDTETSGSSSTVTTTTYRYYGGGIYINNASPTLYDLIITGNTLPAYSYSNPATDMYEYVYSYGGGIFASDTSIEPWNLWIGGNWADDGGGLYANGSASIDTLWAQFMGNGASGGGAVSSAGSVTLQNSILDGNWADGLGSAMGGGGVNAMGGSVWLNYVTSAGNTGSSSNWVSSGATLGLWNSIVSHNGSGYLIDGDVGATLSQTYSDVYSEDGWGFGSAFSDPTGSNGNIAEDPMYVSFSDDTDYTDDNLFLASGSPAADAGDAAESDADGSLADMGAYGGPDGGW